MRNAGRVITVFFILASVPGTVLTAAAQQSLTGGWVVTDWISPDGEASSRHAQGLFIFSESGHYSMMYVTGNSERSLFAGEEGPTDEEKLAAYESFVANSGRYSVSESSITMEAYMAKNPNYMAAFGRDGGNGVSVNYSFADGVLTLAWPGGGTAILRRAD